MLNQFLRPNKADTRRSSAFDFQIDLQLRWFHLHCNTHTQHTTKGKGWEEGEGLICCWSPNDLCDQTWIIMVIKARHFDWWTQNVNYDCTRSWKTLLWKDHLWSLRSTIIIIIIFKDLASIEAVVVVAVYNCATNHHNSRNQITFLLTQILKHKYNTYYMVYYIVYSKENANS